tara:strand:+ start:202 stop:501 length:300 start_codon:yes stop_codon:yes gene_type:complete
VIYGKTIYGNKMILKEATVCYASELGHNNFWYPSNNKLLTKTDCEVEQVSWISGGTKIAIKILKSCLMPLDLTANTTYNISPPTKNQYIIVWIDKCLKN